MSSLLQLLAADQAVNLATTTTVQDADIETLILNVLATNNVGAIAADNQRKLLFYMYAAGLRVGSLVQTWTGGEATKPLSAAAGLNMYNLLAGRMDTAIQTAITSLLGGVGPAFDTLKELADLEITEQGVLTQHSTQIGQLQQALSGFVKADGSTPITGAQQVAAATAGGQAVTLAQMETGVFFGSAMPINVAATGTYDLGTTRATETGTAPRSFIPTGLYVCPKTTTGTLIAAAVISIGTNAPAYDNIRSQVLTNITTINENIPLSLHAVGIAPGTAIKARVTTAQIGGAMTYDVFLTGIYR